jgi:hypothetical protein
MPIRKKVKQMTKASDARMAWLEDLWELRNSGKVREVARLVRMEGPKLGRTEKWRGRVEWFNAEDRNEFDVDYYEWWVTQGLIGLGHAV